MASQDVKYIYKIAPSSPTIPVTPSAELPEGYSLPASELDKKSGFVHMSTAAQIPGTLKHFFPTSSSGRDSVYLLKAPLKPLEDQGLIRWEDPKGEICGPRAGEGMFAHIYDDRKFKLSRDEIEGVVELVSVKEEDDWLASLSKIRADGWLE